MPCIVTQREKEFCDDLASEALPLLAQLAAEPATVAATLEANAGNALTQEEILAVDRRWRLTKGNRAPLVRRYLEHPLTARFHERLEAEPRWLDLFLMDERGCIVAESHKL